MKTPALLLIGTLLTGCGTLQTVVRHDDATASSLKEKKSYCGAVPRIYSGVTYDFCTLHAPLKEGVDAQQYDNATFFILIDAVVSGVLDTALLPYTVYRQHVDGSIIVAN